MSFFMKCLRKLPVNPQRYNMQLIVIDQTNKRFGHVGVVVQTLEYNYVVEFGKAQVLIAHNMVELFSKPLLKVGAEVAAQTKEYDMVLGVITKVTRSTYDVFTGYFYHTVDHSSVAEIGT